ncbi:MAG: arginine--tRNA ligase [Proteobacteria bacterium]|nr:arginine--tRNA ligase [Pseudomonadota bacterium]
MKAHIQQLLTVAVKALQDKQELPVSIDVAIIIDRTRDESHGDFASNIAMLLAKAAKTNPRALAEKIVAALPASQKIEKVEIAGPGFINFYLVHAAWKDIVATIFEQKEKFGRSDKAAGNKILLEYVSSNPTGPLHVGHGRGAAYGASLANLLAAVGYDVHQEYYVNDAGRQMDILAVSVWLRYLQKAGETIKFPSNGYKGEYVLKIAELLTQQCETRLIKPVEDIFQDVLPDEPEGGDKELHIDGLIRNAKKLLGQEDYALVHKTALENILADIKDDLSEFGVNFQQWYSERSLVDSGAIRRAVQKLKDAGYTYEKEGALWFCSIHFGDEKDRVLIRANREPTYFAADVAYHMDKFDRGFNHLINIWGADHHGYIARVKASIQALGHDPEQLEILLVQFAVLYRGEERVQMSTRSGSFVTLRELREEVGNDAARFFYVTRRSEQHMDFDLELAKSQSSDNPVYYIQYAHARICSVFRQLAEKEMSWDEAQGLASLDRLVEAHEKALLAQLGRYPEVIDVAAAAYEPHQIAHYLRELANDFHTYYNAHQFIVPDDALRNARFCLIVAARQVIKNGLTLLGVSAPETM